MGVTWTVAQNSCIMFTKYQMLLSGEFRKQSCCVYQPMNLCEKRISNMEKIHFFYKFWKRSNLLPFWSTISTSLPFVWNELWCRFRNTWLQAWLISLVYLCKFNVVVHTECWKGAFLDYKAKIYRARWFKPEVTGSWIYVTIVSLSILWSAAQVDCKKKGFSGF